MTTIHSWPFGRKMPNLKRSEARQALGPPTPSARLVTGPTQEALHLRCPVCGLLGRLDLVEDGPHTPLYSRLERYGGYSTIIWDPPIPATDEEYDLILARLEAALERLRPRPPFIPPAAPPPPPPPVAPAIPPFTLAKSPGRQPAQALIRHLLLLEELGVDKPEVEQELERLADELEPWVDEIGETISEEEDKDRPNQNRIDRLQEQLETVEEAQSALSEQDISTAMDALERAFIPAPPKVKPVKPRKIPKAPLPPIAERMEAQARTFRPRILTLKERPDRAELERLEQEMTKFYDRVVDSAEASTGETRKRLQSLALRLERSAEAFALAYDALARRDIPTYLQALDTLLECCPA